MLQCFNQPSQTVCVCMCVCVKALSSRLAIWNDNPPGLVPFNSAISCNSLVPSKNNNKKRPTSRTKVFPPEIGCTHVNCSYMWVEQACLKLNFVWQANEVPGKPRSEPVSLYQWGVSQVINQLLKAAPLTPLLAAAIFARVVERGFGGSKYVCDGFGGSLKQGL